MFCCIWFSLVLCLPSVLWHCWLGHLTRKKPDPDMTYNVFGGTLYLAQSIDDIACFALQFYEVGHNWQRVLMSEWTQLHQMWRGHMAIIALCFKVWITCCIFKLGQLKFWVILKTTPNFALFYPSWKLGERWVRSLYELLKLYLWNTSGIYLMAINCAAAECGVLIKINK